MDTTGNGTAAELLGEFLALPGMHGNLVPMLIWPHRLWNTGLRYAPQTVIVTRLVLGLILLRNLASFCQNISDQNADVGSRSAPFGGAT
jgi:hypothetical protein